MDTSRPEPAVPFDSAAQNAAGNLTFEQRVVMSHGGVDPVPGYFLVIFEKRGKAGAVFSRVLRPGERPAAVFRIPFLDWAQRFLSIAVNDSVLTYEFNHSVELDDGRDVFELEFHLTYRVGDPQRVAEIWVQDPLRQLCDEVARVIRRNCARRKSDMFRDRFRDLEKLVVDSEKERLRAYAATLGLKIVSIDLEKPLSDSRRGVIEQGYRAADERDRFSIDHDLTVYKGDKKRTNTHRWRSEDIRDKGELEDLHLQNQLDLNDKREQVKINQQRDALRAAQTQAISTAIGNVAAGINTPEALREAFDVAREIGAGIQSMNSSGLGAGNLINAAQPGLLGSGEENLSNMLAEGIREVERWSISSAQKQSLRSTLLHLVAEAMLDDGAEEATLKQYTTKLSDLAKSFDPPLGRPQRMFLEAFLKSEELKNRLRRTAMS
ncbi:MAG TPA: hypothetical protein VI306_08580 [Pyrinomonadaceae bacterium]